MIPPTTAEHTCRLQHRRLANNSLSNKRLGRDRNISLQWYYETAMKKETVYLEVEDNDNCEYMPMQAYEMHGDPIPIARVRLLQEGEPEQVYRVTGWSSENGGIPCPAMCVPVSDSGQALVHLIYGADWGIRLMADSVEEDWDITSKNQFGEPYLMLTDNSDVELDK